MEMDGLWRGRVTGSVADVGGLQYVVLMLNFLNFLKGKSR